MKKRNQKWDFFAKVEEEDSGAVKEGYIIKGHS
jgi:hypothetical protein